MNKQCVAAAADRAVTMKFGIEPSCDWLAFRFEYERPRSWVCLQLRDPSGRLRYSHLDFYAARQAVLHVDPQHTDLMGVPGPIEAGEWTMTFAFKRPAQVTLEWETGRGIPPEAWRDPQPSRRSWRDTSDGADGCALNRFDWHESREDGYRWYKGDFHTHSRLSDGKMSPERQMLQAKQRGLDFFAVTDHNVLPASWPEGDVLVIPGIEFTSLQKGHWNALGLSRWLDWTDGLLEDGVFTQAMQNRLMEEAGRLGAIRSVNHPMMAHFSWRYTETPLAYIDALEIMNSPNCDGGPGFTEKALVLWGVLWNEGYPIPGLGGSDTHMLPDELYKETGLPSWIGDPANYVYAERLSAASILEAARRGRVYVSRGPELEISLTAGERSIELGSDVTEDVRKSADGAVHCRVTVTGAAGGELQVIENGSVMAVYPLTADEASVEFQFDWKSREYAWGRVDIRRADGGLQAFTNPIYCGSKTPAITTWGELLSKAQPLSSHE